MQALDFEAHLHTQPCIEIGQRLIEQKHRRLAHDCAAHGDALSLPTRQLARLACEQRSKLENLRRSFHALRDLRALDARDLQRIAHVLGDAHMRIERVVLEHHRDVAILRLQSIDHLAGDRDGAFGNAFEPGHHPQQGRFAATRRADHHDELAVRDVHVDTVQHELFAVVGFLNALQSQCSHAVLAFSLLAA